MSEALRVFGKKVQLKNVAQKKWKFEERPGGWVIAVSESGERRRVMFHEFRGKVSAHLGGFLWSGDPVVEDQTQSQQGGDSDLVAQFPGKIRKVTVKVGASVVEGEVLLLVEAMKMEFAIRAPFAGRVREILVKEGQQISPGDRYLDLEALADEGGRGG